MRYHAKGRGGLEKRDFCQIKVILYEKDSVEFCMDLANGKCPPSLAAVIRRYLTEKNASIEDLHAFSGITTAKGRQQTR